ncbi:MAG: DUF2442 domain-containing protein [Planctomycetes bacterium]|nr:DUF2442 domain-containing protein [Planctomycetota bacterium]
MPRINRITGVKVVGDTQLELQFKDGFVSRIDLGPTLWGPVFEPLKSPAYFQQVRLEDDTIRWPNDADFCPDVLRYWCEAGGVRSAEETDEHFATATVATAAS